MDTVMVLDGRQRSSLAVVRSLGKRGIRIVVGEENQPCLASRSKYCHHSFNYVSPSNRPFDFIDSILKELKKNSYAMIIPTTDVTCSLVSQYEKEIAKVTKVPLVDKATFSKAADKFEVINLCRDLNIPIPESYSPKGIDDVISIAANLNYPVVIKPRRSKYLIDSGWISTGVDYAFSSEELIEKFRGLDSLLPLPLIQERIQGPGVGAFALFNSGEVRAIFFHKRIREKPPSGGVSVLRESIAIDPLLQDYSIRILNALRWHGVAMVEFKLDQKDNLPKIMEINGRFWGSLQLAVDSGLDFPYMLYKMTMDGDVTPQFEYKVGMQSRWLMGDVDHLLARILKSNKALQLPNGFPSRLWTLYEFCKFAKPNMKYEILRFSDIRPFFHELWEWFRLLGKD